jgi:hypothetical protein
MLLPPSRRLAELEQWFHTDLLTGFRERILRVTYAVADRWGVLGGVSAGHGRRHDCLN